MEAELLTLAETAQLLRLQPSTIRAWRLLGKNLTFRKIGGRVRVLKSDVLAFIDASSIVPAR